MLRYLLSVKIYRRIYVSVYMCVNVQAAANAHHQLKMANSIVHQRPLLIKLLVSLQTVPTQKKVNKFG